MCRNREQTSGKCYELSLHFTADNSVLVEIGYLGGNIGVLFPVAVTVVGVDVVRAHHPVHWLENHPAVVVGDNVGIPATQLSL